ncbi:MAG: cell division topological specificity factor MinE [Syntrophomonadaceae bacterium]|nr:cell division topological specificity factor MinE [Syntrophomonadaceae bacterium]
MMEFAKKGGSSDTANERLHLVLMHDRIGTSSGILEQIKDEIIKVILKHIDVDAEPEVNLTSQGRQSVLDINIPLKGR